MPSFVTPPASSLGWLGSQEEGVSPQSWRRLLDKQTASGRRALCEERWVVVVVVETRPVLRSHRVALMAS